MWISGVEHDSIFVYNEKWPPQQVQLPSVTMKVTKKFFSLWWELPESTLLAIEVNDFLWTLLEWQMQST